MLALRQGHNTADYSEFAIEHITEYDQTTTNAVTPIELQFILMSEAKSLQKQFCD